MKQCCSIFTLLFCAMSLSAQTKIVAQIKGGYNFMRVTSDIPTPDIDQNYLLGAGLDFITESGFYFGGELMYEQRGYSFSFILTDAMGNQIGDAYTTPYRYDYLSIPLKVGFSTDKKLYYFGDVGIIPAVILKAQTTFPLISGSPQQYTGDSTSVFTEDVNQFDLAGFMEAGLGYKINDKFSTAASLRYQYSFTSLSGDDFYSDSPMHFEGISVNLALRFVMGGGVSHPEHNDHF